MITGGFGMSFDAQTGVSRSWYIKNGVKYWADNNKPVETGKPKAKSKESS